MNASVLAPKVERWRSQHDQGCSKWWHTGLNAVCWVLLSTCIKVMIYFFCFCLFQFEIMLFSNLLQLPTAVQALYWHAVIWYVRVLTDYKLRSAGDTQQFCEWQKFKWSNGRRVSTVSAAWCIVTFEYNLCNVNIIVLKRFRLKYVLFICSDSSSGISSVCWSCWLGARRGIRPVKSATTAIP